MSISDLVLLTGESYELVSKLYISYQREYMDLHGLVWLETLEVNIYAFNSVYNLLK